MDLPGLATSSRESESALRPSVQAKPIRRRNRMINSCLECRKRKLKCSKTSPTCTNCAKASRDCLYIGPRLDEASQMRLAEIKEKQGTLERQLERDVAKSTTSKTTLQQRILADEVADDYDDEGDLEATPLVALDLTYEDDADGGADDIIDLGIRIGKMRITERIGGLSRPRISEEIYAGIERLSGGHSSKLRGKMPAFEDIPDGMLDTSVPDSLKPTNQYMVPASGFFFGQVGVSHNTLQYLPSRQAADRLMAQYFRSVHPIAPCSHRPSMEAGYTMFWEELRSNIEPRPSTQALIFATMFSGLVSMDDDVVIREFGGYSKANWVARLKIGTETALSKANFLRTTRMETMQAFITYMIPVCRAEVSRAHSVLVGAAVRMAECMGLHRDGEAYGLTPLETHVRRLVWHQLCFLDIRTCEAQGPKPIIRRDDYDTKLPMNYDDEELQMTPPPEPSDKWTSNTLPLIRFEVNEMMRNVWIDRRRLEARRTTLTAVLTKIEKFRRRMSEKYDPLLDASSPLQRYARCVMYLLTYRLHIMVLHPYYANASIQMPPRLSHLLVTSGIMVVELAIHLETNSQFHAWAWYFGAYFQYQIALLLATEVFFHPQSREADRIWPCLDYVFGFDRKMSPEEKSLQLLREISSRTEVYMRKRKMRGPNSTTQATVSANAVGGTSSSSSSSFHPHHQAGDMPHQQQDHHQHNPQLQPPHQVQRHPCASISQTPQGHGPIRLPKSEQGYSASQIPLRASTLPAQPNMVYAGVSDGQVLWSLPPNIESPNSSDSSGLAAASMGAAAVGVGVAGGPSTISVTGPGSNLQDGNIMDDIDWNAMYTLFPNDTQTGELSIQGFDDPNFSVNWSS